VRVSKVMAAMSYDFVFVKPHDVSTIQLDSNVYSSTDQSLVTVKDDQLHHLVETKWIEQFRSYQAGGDYPGLINADIDTITKSNFSGELTNYWINEEVDLCLISEEQFASLFGTFGGFDIRRDPHFVNGQWCIDITPITIKVFLAPQQFWLPIKRRKRQSLSYRVSRFLTAKEMRRLILRKLQKDLAFAITEPLSRLWLLDAKEMPKLQGGGPEVLVDAMQIELGAQSNIETGMIEIENESGRLLEN
jgi:hypothetical protein